MGAIRVTRFGGAAALLVSVLCGPMVAGVPGSTPAPFPAELARSMPSSTLLYAMVDADRLTSGNLQSGLLSLCEEPGLADFLAPLAGQVPLLQPGALRHLLEESPLRNWLAGSVELAVQGVAITIDGETFRVDAHQPPRAALVNRCLGLAASIGIAMEQGQALGHKVSIAPDFVLRFEAGPAIRPLLEQALQEVDARITSGTIGGQAVKVLSFADEREVPGVAMDLYLAERSGALWLAGNADTLGRCLAGAAGGPSLAEDAAFQKLVRRVSAGEPSILVYANVAHLGRLAAPLMAPILKEELDLLGVTGIEALGFASSFTEGGVRDTLALTYNETPHGLLSLLDLTSGSFRFAGLAPADTSLYLGARLDLEALVDQVEMVLDDLFPGTGAVVSMAAEEANRELPLDLRREILPALGTEVGVYLTAPGGAGFLPRGLLMMEVGDAAEFRKLLGLAQQALAHEGVVMDELRSVPEGWQGFSLKIPDAPFQPAFALSDHALVASLNGLWLRQDLKALEARGSQDGLLGKDTFGQVLTGLRGANSLDDMSLLAYVDLRRLVEIGYQMVPMAAAAAPPEVAQNMDLSLLPDSADVARHFSGIGIAGVSDAEGLSLSLFGPVGIGSAWLGGTLGLAMGDRIVQAHDAPAHDHELARADEEVIEEELVADEVVEEAALVEEEIAEEVLEECTLAQCFQRIETDLGATILYPERLGDLQLAWSGPGTDLDATLRTLAEAFDFSFEVEDRGGERLVRIRG